MANIKLKELVEANIDPKLTARSKETGKLVYFKTPQAKQAAMKAGTHEDPKAKKGDEPKGNAKPNSMFGGDYAKNRGGESSKDDKKLNKLLNKHGITKDLAQKASDEATKLAANVSKGKGPENINDGDGKDMVDSIKNAKINTDETTKELTSKLQKSPYGKFVKDDKNDNMTFFFYDGSKYEMHIDRKNKLITTKNLGGEEPTPKVNLPKKASQLTWKDGDTIADMLNKEVGLEGIADTMNSSMDPNNNTIAYTASSGDEPTYTLYFGMNDDYGKPDEFRVSLEPTYGNDPAKLQGKHDKSFKSPKDAMTYMTALGKKYKKEMQMDDEDTNESTKLTSMFKK